MGHCRMLSQHLNAPRFVEGFKGQLLVFYYCREEEKKCLLCWPTYDRLLTSPFLIEWTFVIYGISLFFIIKESKPLHLRDVIDGWKGVFPLRGILFLGNVWEAFTFIGDWFLLSESFVKWRVETVFFPPTVWKMKPFFSVTTIHFFCLFSSTCCCIINEKSRVLYWIVWCCLFRRKDQALYFSRKFNVMYAPIPKFTRYILNFVFIKIQFRIYIGAEKKTYCTYLTNQVSRCQMSIHCADELSLDVGLAVG